MVYNRYTTRLQQVLWLLAVTVIQLLLNNKAQVAFSLARPESVTFQKTVQKFHLRFQGLASSLPLLPFSGISALFHLI